MQEIGEIINESFENGCGLFSWMINNVSSLMVAKDNFLQCPAFSFKQGMWNLKIYPYGYTGTFPEGRIGIIMQRLHSKVSVHNIFYRIFFKGENSFVSPSLCGTLVFDPNQAKRVICCEFFQKFDCYKCNDTITLVCEILTYKMNPQTEMDYFLKALQTDFSEYFFFLIYFIFIFLIYYFLNKL